ncbi:hypothetical protein CEXT_122331 [Caerostris extrusa]|uniref:Ycf15 n=1 Tax=Caerostris extrusa TaxID=172846 RepID=A0AAV4YED4_CAEEX|nr:hypothetical protein CEXT_122331 [Caerostris extrusa]
MTANQRTLPFKRFKRGSFIVNIHSIISLCCAGRSSRKHLGGRYFTAIYKIPVRAPIHHEQQSAGQTGSKNKFGRPDSPDLSQDGVKRR